MEVIQKFKSPSPLPYGSIWLKKTVIRESLKAKKSSIWVGSWVKKTLFFKCVKWSKSSRNAGRRSKR